jgi:hypothetical protein
MLQGPPAGQRAELPVFSANGVIPFASQQEKAQDIWEVPDTPPARYLSQS